MPWLHVRLDSRPKVSSEAQRLRLLCASICSVLTTNFTRTLRRAGVSLVSDRPARVCVLA